jgi:CHAT domain-containing protein
VVALGEAKQSAYPELYLRALFFAADVDAMSGDLNSAWRQTHDGLALSVASGQSMMRTYSFETELDILTDQAGKKSFDEVILSEAIRTIDGDQDILLRAMAHHRLAEVALSVGDTPNANENFRVALNLFAAAPNSAVTNNHRTEAEIGLARAELQHGDFVEAVDRLKAVNESDLNVSNRYLLLEYYQSLGDAKAKLGDLTGAAKAFGAALALTESTLSNLRSDKERIDWDHAAGGIYRNVVELRLQQHDEEAALELWEWYKGASIRTSSGLDDSALVDNGNISPTYLNTIAAHLPDLQEVHRQLPLLVNETVISFAVLRDGIAAWAYDNRGIQFHWISDKNGEFATRAQRFAELCADPRSDQHTLGVLGRVLYDGLVAPFRKRFSGGRTLVVIPDGTLWSIPLQALMQPDGKYLIESVALVEIPGFYFRQTLRAVKPFTGKETVLVIAVPETIEFNGMTLPELPEVERESASVAAKFPNSIILQSTQRSAGVVNSYLPRAEIFHFAGHAVKTEGGVALVIATSLHKGQKPQTITVSSIGSVRLESLRLVVLSACSTENSADSNSLSDEGSLARALLRAGIPQVVASSWSVDSGATESFMDVFYQALLHGQPTAQGLRQAMLRVRSQPGRQHPYYWAAFSNFGSV